MNFLKFKDKTYFITGINNKKSVAYFCAKSITDFGGKIITSVQNEKQVEFVKSKFPEATVYICDVSDSKQIKELGNKVSKLDISLSGMLHSIAFAKFTSPSINEVPFEEFSEALKISAYSLVELSQALKDSFSNDACVVTVSISNLRATNYGYMGPIKSLLNSSIDYLAKEFSKFSNIRFNSVAAGPLKTSASAGIPGYVENYLYCEKLTLRKHGLKTSEVSNTVMFLLSNASSGINAETITVDAGMNVNYFDSDVVSPTQP